jgi:hypothetical protein
MVLLILADKGLSLMPLFVFAIEISDKSHENRLFSMQVSF